MGKILVINDENRNKIQEAIDQAQEKAKVRLIDSDDVYAAIKAIEERLCFIPKKYWAGVSAKVNVHAQKFANSYNGIPEATLFEIEYKSGNWRLTDVYRGICKNKYVICDLTDTLKKEAVSRIVEYLEDGR